MHENNPDGSKPKRHLLNNSEDGIDTVGTGHASIDVNLTKNRPPVRRGEGGGVVLGGSLWSPGGGGLTPQQLKLTPMGLSSVLRSPAQTDPALQASQTDPALKQSPTLANPVLQASQSHSALHQSPTGVNPILPLSQSNPILKQSPTLANSDLQPFLESLRSLGIELADEQLDQFLRYRQELLDWNTRINLTSISNPEEILIKHFLDSLSLLMIFDTPIAHVLDIGSGAGFPGLPLKILRPQWHVVLLEATGKKVTFMQHIIETLHLHNVESIHGRAEELAINTEYRTSFDLVTARAVASLPTLLEYAAPFTRSGGTMIFPKKGDLTGELARGKRAASQLGARFQDDSLVTLPGLDDGRRLLVWEQVSKCPEQYPRSGSVMAKKPLGQQKNFNKLIQQ